MAEKESEVYESGIGLSRMSSWVMGMGTRGYEVAGSAGHKVAHCGAVIRCLGAFQMERATARVTHRRGSVVPFEIATSAIVADTSCVDVDNRNNISRVFASPVGGTRSMEGNSKWMPAHTCSDHSAIPD